MSLGQINCLNEAPGETNFTPLFNYTLSQMYNTDQMGLLIILQLVKNQAYVYTDYECDNID